MRTLLLTFNLLCAGDALTTHAVINKGGMEAWLPTQNPWVIDAAVVVQALTADMVLLWTRRTHPKTALALAVGLSVLRSYAVVHNLGVLGELSR